MNVNARSHAKVVKFTARAELHFETLQLEIRRQKSCTVLLKGVFARLRTTVSPHINSFETLL